MSATDSIDRVFVTSKPRSDGIRSALRLPKRRSAFANSVGGSLDLTPRAASGADSQMRVVHDSLIKPDKPSTDPTGFQNKRVVSMPASALQWLKPKAEEVELNNHLKSPHQSATREPTPESTRGSEWADIFDLYEDRGDYSSGADEFFNSSSSQTPSPAQRPSPQPPRNQYRSVSGPVSFSPRRRPTPQELSLQKSTDDFDLAASTPGTTQIQKQPSALRRLVDKDIMPWLSNAKRRLPSSTASKAQQPEGRGSKNSSSRKGERSRDKGRPKQVAAEQAAAELDWNAQQIIEQFRAFARQTIVLQPIDSLIDFFPSLALVLVLVEAVIMMWLLYQLSVIVETTALLLRAICLPLVIIGRLIGCM